MHKKHAFGQIEISLAELHQICPSVLVIRMVQVYAMEIVEEEYMVFVNKNKWYIRGIVSVSIALQEEARCDPNHYAVFTDVAKFTNWIENNI